MTKLPGALLVVDPGKEDIAVKEAKKLEIPIVGMVDTDTDPELVDIVIPCNDDAFRSIKVVLTKLTDAIVEGAALWQERRVVEEKAQAEARRLTEAARSRIEKKRESRPRRRAPEKPRGAARPDSRQKRADKPAEKAPAAKPTEKAPAPKADEKPPAEQPAETATQAPEKKAEASKE
jgi:small subunit ribosomal protein S2